MLEGHTDGLRGWLFQLIRSICTVGVKIELLESEMLRKSIKITLKNLKIGFFWRKRS